MKPLKPPGYVVRKQYHHWHQVSGYGLCPSCGRFACVQHTTTSTEFKTQYRSCECGHRFQTVTRLIGD